ncbi:MAG: protein kinase [Myxococcales bacterium]|nr:protein kinase [Myxococcales bacterium]
MASNDGDEGGTSPYQVDTGAATESEQLREQRKRGATIAPSPDERYQLLELLGQGGMGQVIAAHDSVLGRDVAIKRMRSDTPSALQISRFLREAHIQGLLDHPTIPPVHELAHDERGLPYFVMKRLSGMTLGKIIDRLAAGDPAVVAQFPRSRLLRAFVDVCLAVELAHTRGIIHRDIKPANIMLGEFGEVFLIDWGVAKVTGDFDPWAGSSNDAAPEVDATVPGTVIGTPGYMSPEQRHGDEVDARSDIFALGCVLFEILTFMRVPAESGVHASLRPSQHEPDVSPELDALCVKATAPVPAARVASARELGAVTQRFLDGDRDLELRKRLADEHYRRAARAALKRDIDDGQERLAIREAGRALALNPTHANAAQLVTWFMLEPPRLLPDELTRELQEAAMEERQRQARIGIGAYAVLGVFIPHLVWAGIRKPLPVVALVVVLGLLIGHAFLGTRTIRFPRFAPILTLSLSAILVALLARMYSPFIIAPGVAALTGVVLMGSAMFRTKRLVAAAIGVLSLAVVGPYMLEALGVISPTIRLTGDEFVISNLALELPPLPTGLGLTGYVIGFIGVATIVSWAIANRFAEAQRRLHIQAWQLRQLIPDAAASSS